MSPTTLELAMAAAGLDQVDAARQRPRLLSDNGSSYVAGDLADWLEEPRHGSCPRCALPSNDTGKDRTLAPDAQEPHLCLSTTICPAISRCEDRRLRRSTTITAAIRWPAGAATQRREAREPRQSDTSRCLLRTRPDHSVRKGKDQTKDVRAKTLAASAAGRLNHPTK